VARSLDLARPIEAQSAFMRALRRCPQPEQDALIGRERKRLDKLEARVRRGDRDDPIRLARRLAALERLRQAVS
jgi:hypothetical protein